MPRRHTRLGATLAALAVFAALALAAAVLVACGDDFSGTWKATMMGESLTLKIEKDGDNYKVTNPDEPDSEAIKGTVKDGKLVMTDPEGSGESMTLERDGDNLVMKIGGVTVTFEKQ